jgi:hypothetical protein
LCQAFKANASKPSIMTMACALHGSSFMVRGDEGPSRCRSEPWRDGQPETLDYVVDLQNTIAT